jgi:hypothetical protein
MNCSLREMSGRLFLNLTETGLRQFSKQGMNEILADAVEFNAYLVVRSLGSVLVEVKDQSATPELKRVALLDRFQVSPRASCAAVTSKIP